ncbi:hypothetical protein [Romboutsia ilealis]|uniref:hypothetical protein n=1 Tax=Romboutsia ilealis TaxID=1115758 RepID=UPI00273027A2|nr:hypothetical protein [Romboutsia ilealis]
MSEYTPQQDFFVKLQKTEKFRCKVFWISIIGSAIIPLFNNSNINSIFTIISLIVLIYLDVQLDYYRSNAEKKRRSDLFDNSFGTKYNHDKSKGYYSNDEIPNGTYKIATNVFQNCFWSLNISTKMKEKEKIKNIAIGGVIVLFAVFGFLNNMISIPVLQLFLSQEFLVKYINLDRYNRELEDIFEELKDLFSRNLNDNIESEQARVLNIIVRYECNISNWKIDLDSNIFNSEDARLEKEWSKIKNTYNIK